MFLVNVMLALVLFNLIATGLFESISLSNKFNVAPGLLDCPLEVESVDDLMVNASRYERDYVLEMFRVHFPIDLIPISPRAVRIIMDIDWLIQFGL